MNKYLKENLILGDWLENYFGWITLTLGSLPDIRGWPLTPTTPPHPWPPGHAAPLEELARAQRALSSVPKSHLTKRHIVRSLPGSSSLSKVIQAHTGSLGSSRIISVHPGSSGLVRAHPGSSGLVRARPDSWEPGLGPRASYHSRTVKSSSLTGFLRKDSLLPSPFSLLP